MQPEGKNIARQAYAGLLWNKQFYHYSVKEWLFGDPGQPPPPPDTSTFATSTGNTFSTAT